MPLNLFNRFKRNREFAQAIDYFAGHPDEVVLQRGVSGFHNSYFKTPAGVFRLLTRENKSEPKSYIVGQGAYGRVKRIEDVAGQHLVVKTIPIHWIFDESVSQGESLLVAKPLAEQIYFNFALYEAKVAPLLQLGIPNGAAFRVPAGCSLPSLLAVREHSTPILVGVYRPKALLSEQCKLYIVMPDLGPSLGSYMRRLNADPIPRTPLWGDSQVEVRCRLAAHLWIELFRFHSGDLSQGVGFAHRDIKPANVLLNPEGRLRLGDVGSATKKLTGFLGDALCGTAIYYPETNLNFISNVQADCFAALQTVFYMRKLKKDASQESRSIWLRCRQSSIFSEETFQLLPIDVRQMLLQTHAHYSDECVKSDVSTSVMYRQEPLVTLDALFWAAVLIECLHHQTLDSRQLKILSDNLSQQQRIVAQFYNEQFDFRAASLLEAVHERLLTYQKYLLKKYQIVIRDDVLLVNKSVPAPQLVQQKYEIMTKMLRVIEQDGVDKPAETLMRIRDGMNRFGTILARHQPSEKTRTTQNQRWGLFKQGPSQGGACVREVQKMIATYPQHYFDSLLSFRKKTVPEPVEPNASPSDEESSDDESTIFASMSWSTLPS